MSEMYRISKSTAWDKDLKVLDDNVKAVDIQVGPDAGDSLNIPLGPLTPRQLRLKEEVSSTDATGDGAAFDGGAGNFDGTVAGVAIPASTPPDVDDGKIRQTSGVLTFPANKKLGTDYVLSVSVTDGRSVTIMAEDVTDVDDLVSKLNSDIDTTNNDLKFRRVANTNTIELLHSTKTFSAVITRSVDTSGIDTLADASKALAVIDDAQEIVNAQRSKLGAAMNRVQYTISNLMNVVENTSEAKSRIYDTDYAAESAALARTQVLAQAGTAMLAQANQSTQYVLNLLRQG
jgi:flagellin-like hook-associated protein FlgL